MSGRAAGNEGIGTKPYFCTYNYTEWCSGLGVYAAWQFVTSMADNREARVAGR